jgi:hypothetical protein
MLVLRLLFAILVLPLAMPLVPRVGRWAVLLA